MVPVKDLFDELKTIVISVCESDGGDLTCSFQDSIDQNREVINIGDDVSNPNQFACLVNNGDTSSPNYNEHDTIGDEINGDDNLEEEICERPNTKSNT